jgi:hypothetical protein
MLRHWVDGLGLASEMIHRLCFAAILGSPAVVLAETAAQRPADEVPAPVAPSGQQH